MVSSQEIATVAALEELGYKVPTTLKVLATIEGIGAFGMVEPGDVVVSIDGERVAGYSGLPDSMDAVSPGDVVHVGVLRDGVLQDLEVTTVGRRHRAGAARRVSSTRCSTCQWT